MTASLPIPLDKIRVIDNALPQSSFASLELTGTKHFREGRNVYEIDSRKTKYFDMKASYLNPSGRRKIENLVIMQHGKDNPIIRFV